MRHLEKRITAVESRDRTPTKFVWRNSDETPDEAITRTRVSADDLMIISWHDEPKKLERKA